jgi:hypothetical protein
MKKVHIMQDIAESVLNNFITTLRVPSYGSDSELGKETIDFAFTKKGREKEKEEEKEMTLMLPLA